MKSCLQFHLAEQIKPSFLVAYYRAGFKSFKAFAPFKISVQCTNVQQRVFLHLVYAQAVSLPSSSAFSSGTAESFRLHLEKIVGKAHQLILLVLNVIISASTSIMQKCSPSCLHLDVCWKSGGLTCAWQSGWVWL